MNSPKVVKKVNSGIVEKDYGGAALILRCFLLLVDLSKGPELPAIQEKPVEVKEEIIDTDFATVTVIPLEETPDPSSCMVIDTNLYDEQTDESSDEENTFIGKKRKRTLGPKRSASQANICRGKGCNCNVKFMSREELRLHYIERECYKFGSFES